ncbi:MAG: NUDIX domain-containing protein [Bacteroidales bacterium]
MTNDNEIFPIVDESGTVIGKSTRAFCHSGAKPLHPVVHLHIFNDKGELYLQKRSKTKDIQPDKWDTAVGGHIDYGEDTETALKRETSEELGITLFKYIFCFRYVFESKIEKELVTSYRTIYNGVITPDMDEVDEGRFWSISQIRESIGKGIFTPNFESEFSRLSTILSL